MASDTVPASNASVGLIRCSGVEHGLSGDDVSGKINLKKSCRLACRLLVFAQTVFVRIAALETNESEKPTQSH